MVIWKYPLRLEDFQTVDLPVGSKILTVQLQNEMPYLWALVDPEAPPVPCGILILATGEPTSSNPGEYINTLQWRHLVFHVFKKV